MKKIHILFITSLIAVVFCLWLNNHLSSKVLNSEKYSITLESIKYSDRVNIETKVYNFLGYVYPTILPVLGDTFEFNIIESENLYIHHFIKSMQLRCDDFLISEDSLYKTYLPQDEEKLGIPNEFVIPNDTSIIGKQFKLMIWHTDKEYKLGAREKNVQHYFYVNEVSNVDSICFTVGSKDNNFYKINQKDRVIRNTLLINILLIPILGALLILFTELFVKDEKLGAAILPFFILISSIIFLTLYLKVASPYFTIIDNELDYLGRLFVSGMVVFLPIILFYHLISVELKNKFNEDVFVP